MQINKLKNKYRFVEFLVTLGRPKLWETYNENIILINLSSLGEPSCWQSKSSFKMKIRAEFLTQLMKKIQELFSENLNKIWDKMREICWQIYHIDHKQEAVSDDESTELGQFIVSFQWTERFFIWLGKRSDWVLTKNRFSVDLDRTSNSHIEIIL